MHIDMPFEGLKGLKPIRVGIGGCSTKYSMFWYQGLTN